MKWKISLQKSLSVNNLSFEIWQIVQPSSFSDPKNRGPQQISKIYQLHTRVGNIQLKHPICTQSPVCFLLRLLFSQRNLAFMILHSHRHKSWVCLLPRPRCHRQLKKGLYTHEEAGRYSEGIGLAPQHWLVTPWLKPVLRGSGANLWPEPVMIAVFIS